MDNPGTYTEAEVQILEAALAVFARKGRDGARMQEIADAAGVNKAMLHYYFRSKDRLYEAVFGYVMRRFMASFEAATHDAATFADFLRAFIYAYVDFVAGHVDVMRLMVNENLSGGDMMARHIDRLGASDAPTPPRLFVRQVEAAVGRGEIRPVDPLHLLVSVVSLSIFPFVVAPTLRSIIPSSARDWDAFLEARKRHVFDVLYSGLALQTP